MSTETSDALTVGKKLVAFCSKHQNHEAIKALYSDQVESVEPCEMPGSPATRKGIDEVLAKNQWWSENHEVHSGTCTGPFPHGDRFIVFFDYDVTAKAGPMAGTRMQIREAGLYTVADGKIVKEEFFYDMGG